MTHLMSLIGDDQQGIYIAPSLDSTQISLLIPSGNTWQVYGYQEPHTVSFENKFLTGIPELDEKILMNLNAKDLFNACAVNQYVQSVCQADTFWKKKIIKDYCSKVLAVEVFDKTFKEKYRRLSHGFVTIEELLQMQVNDVPNGFYLESRSPHVTLPTPLQVTAIQTNGVEVFYRHRTIHGSPNINTRMFTSSHHPGSFFLEYKNGNWTRPYLEYSEEIRFIYTGDPTLFKNYFNTLARTGDLDALIRLNHYELPLKEILIAASETGQTNILRWLIQTNKLDYALKATALRTAATNNQVEILRELIAHGVQPDFYTALIAVYSGHLEVVKLIYEYYADVTYLIERALDYNQPHIAAWLIQKVKEKR